MAGYTDKREQNYEIKYLRKVLGQVDKRIQVPQSVNAASLRALLDDIPQPAPVDIARRRPRWLSLQSGVAYAAAFVLIVALFYSMELYKPEMINGGMRIGQSELSDQDIAPASIPEDQGTIRQTETAQSAQTHPVTESGAVFMPEPDSVSEVAGGSVPETVTFSAEDNVGGGGESVLMLEQGERAYYGRANDISDPDRPNPATLEIIDTGSQEIIAQIGIPGMSEIDHCFALEDVVLVTGKSENGVLICVYSAADGEVAEMLSIEQPGELVDARLYKGVAHIVSIAEAPSEDGEIIRLPYTDASDSCVITAVGLDTLESAQKSFVGAKGTIQLHSLNAYIHYEGVGENDMPENYIGQILFDGIDIELGTVS